MGQSVSHNWARGYPLLAVREAQFCGLVYLFISIIRRKTPFGLLGSRHLSHRRGERTVGPLYRALWHLREFVVKHIVSVPEHYLVEKLVRKTFLHISGSIWAPKVLKIEQNSLLVQKDVFEVVGQSGKLDYFWLKMHHLPLVSHYADKVWCLTVFLTYIIRSGDDFLAVFWQKRVQF